VTGPPDSSAPGRDPAETAGRAQQSAEELHQRAVEASLRGTYPLAAQLLRRALTRCDPASPLRARVLLSLAWVEAEQSHIERSLSLLDQAETAAAAHPSLAGVTHGQRGLLLLRLGRSAAARDQLARAVGLLDDQPVEQVKALLNLGVAEKDERHFAAAEAAFLRSAAKAETAGEELLAGKAISNLGELAALRGDLPLALSRFEQAIELFGDADPVDRAVTIVDSSYALTTAGLFGEAEADLLVAARILSESRMTLSEAEAWQALAEIALADGRDVDCRRYTRKALRLFSRRGSTVGTMVSQALLLITAPPRTAGPEHVANTSALAERLDHEGLPDLASRLRLRVGLRLVDAGRVDDAERLTEPLRLTASSDLLTRILARELRAAVAGARQDRRGRAGHLRAGLADLQAHQSRLGSVDLQTSVVRHGAALAQMALADAIRAGRPLAALRCLERTRAIATRLAPVQPPEDDRMAALLEELRHLRLELRQRESSGETDRSALAALRGSCRTLERAAAVRERQLVGSGDVAAETTATALRAALGQGPDDVGGFAALFDVDGDLHGLVLEAGDARLARLGPAGPIYDQVRRTRADLDVLALAGTPAVMRSVVLRSLHASLDRLDAMLWQPLGAGDAGPLVLVPTGPLSTTPWQLLPSLRGRPLAVARSAGEWLRGRDWRSGEDHESDSRPTVFATGPRVERAAEEVQAAAAHWPGATVLTLAQPQELISATAGAGLVHVAAHGMHDADNPLFSSLELRDGLVFGHDLTRVHPPPRHVVLSACDLGLASIRPGGESLGMTAALLHVGTGSVVSGVARVADGVACDVAVAYHRRLSGGERPSYALAGALADTGSDGSGDTLAPLTCFGSGW
jgi:tetratricopeptide (TPR) repeat protein